ncbi:hypothetical protein EU545_05250 [Candidatus Thorarchaeota archaeon]|nr:MAG: hypothetical protein EU545_05250 [Candidatus Thorarchaeota archaeon]
MSWIAKIIEKNPDEYSHARMVKYGPGEHVGPRIKLTFSKTTIRFKADIDLEKDFIDVYLSGAPEGSQKVKGNIITYTDRRDAFSNLTMPLEWKKSKGKYKSKVAETAPIKDVKQLLEIQDPTTFYLLSINPAKGGKPWKVKTKTSFPKGAPKGGADEEEEKDPTFTKGAFANTPEIMEMVLDTFLPDFKDLVGPKTKKISLWNKIIIDAIKPPDDPNLSFAEKRRLAKKRGKLIRTVDIGGEEHVKEYDFVVGN